MKFCPRCGKMHDVPNPSKWPWESDYWLCVECRCSGDRFAGTPNSELTEGKGPAFGGNDWGLLPLEPCRYCHQQGGVQFLASNQPLDQHAQQVRCVNCGRAWEA